MGFSHEKDTTHLPLLRGGLFNDFIATESYINMAKTHEGIIKKLTPHHQAVLSANDLTSAEAQRSSLGPLRAHQIKNISNKPPLKWGKGGKLFSHERETKGVYLLYPYEGVLFSVNQ